MSVYRPIRMGLVFMDYYVREIGVSQAYFVILILKPFVHQTFACFHFHFNTDGIRIKNTIIKLIKEPNRVKLQSPF